MHSVSSISDSNLFPYLRVQGEIDLSGQIEISGAKNSALVLMAASLLTEEPIHLSNVPKLTDIDVMAKLLSSIGANVNQISNELDIKTNGLSLSQNSLPYELVNALRASFVCIGPLLARFGEVKIPLPGGCRIGARPINEHIRGLRALGATVTFEGENVLAKTTNLRNKLIGTKIRLTCKSVGATETILMASILAEGKTTIENAAREPEIQDLANMLTKMGAKIKGAGTSTIIIEGVDHLKGCIHKVIPDRIEAGTFLIASAITRCPITIFPVIPKHLEAVLIKLQECGCLIKQTENTIKIIPGKTIYAVDITTMPFPGFPTDLQAPFMSLLSTAKGTSKIEETIFEKRMQHVGELQRMGAQIQLHDNIALIQGVNKLFATSLTGGDLRSSAAMVLAGLVAKGTSVIKGLSHLDRGYENFEKKLCNLGANIKRTEVKRPISNRKNTEKLESKMNVGSGSQVA